MTLGTKFLALSPARRALVFEQAAAGQAGQAVILEKDFWVTWLLGHPDAAQFLADVAQCSRVVDWKMLDPMWRTIPPSLMVHIDGLCSTCPKPANK